MRKRWLKLAAVPVALAFVAASCSTEDEGGSSGGDSSTTAGEDAGTTTADEGTTADDATAQGRLANQPLSLAAATTVAASAASR